MMNSRIHLSLPRLLPRTFRYQSYEGAGLSAGLRGAKQRSNLLLRVGIASSGYALLAMTLALTSCSPVEILAAPAPTSLPSMTPSLTPTIVWFPPSATPSPELYLTRTATAEMRPGLGELLVNDNFAYADLWDVATSDKGSATIKDNRLTIGVQPGVYLISFRHDLIVSNFYAEITAKPDVCRGDDSYGLLVRANAVAYYRFALYCNGMVGAERISVGTRQILQKPIPSGDVPPGAPGEVRIGLWAVGNEMRLFLNGRFQFSLTESTYPSGTIGVFAHSAGENAMAVIFADPEIQKVTYLPPTSTPKP